MLHFLELFDPRPRILSIHICVLLHCSCILVFVAAVNRNSIAGLCLTKSFLTIRARFLVGFVHVAIHLRLLGDSTTFVIELKRKSLSPLMVRSPICTMFAACSFWFLFSFFLSKFFFLYSLPSLCLPRLWFFRIHRTLMVRCDSC